MASVLKAIFDCLSGSNDVDTNYVHEKQVVLSPNYHSADTIGADLVNAILTAEKCGKELQTKLDEIVSEYGWKEWIAEKFLASLEQAVKAGAKMAQTMKEAFERAIKEAADFAKEHPAYVTLIALGILVAFAPVAIEALGFAELGPVEGSFAAAWQARYAGYVPKGSLFSYFQRLGMKWHY
ncbi:hypothetical protein K469DRAFT_598771 [Zopfia rhizophila CBS 207.26]|uniref:Uncharacterized protein n=1 Tax=Zopfia rhizophila CBS 207.26 TaxID=1314779 RepID=A0A6A6DIF2_9PEZI|nr:hypothetical protein K469DRAFT_598771 [Zopfia rhizophila CBS 207.26]